ncbi:hypothetical protein B7486_17190 [cyanobacterium TDX16]|nr:hypothetical protein B7486_17190 [cyanobacterium TDX16]
MTKNFLAAATLCLTAGFFDPSIVMGQAGDGAASQPAVKTGELVYEVVEVGGKVAVSPTGTDAQMKEGWTPVAKGQTIGAGQQLRVPTRSRIKMVARPADPPTVILIEQMTLINIGELAMMDGAAHSRIQIQYGAIKAGVAEGTSRSDMEIEAPTATLSKKGTDIFGFEVQADGRFKMFLTANGRGLVQGIINQSGAFGSSRMNSRFLTPGQWITHQMIRAIDNVQFDREVMVNDIYGLKGVDQLFTLLNNHGGVGFLLPVGSNTPGFLGGASQRDGLTTTDLNTNPQSGNNLAGVLQTSTQIRHVTGGDFGVGQGSLPGFFGGPPKLQLRRDCGTPTGGLCKPGTPIQAGNFTRR